MPILNVFQWITSYIILRILWFLVNDIILIKISIMYQDASWFTTDVIDSQEHHIFCLNFFGRRGWISTCHCFIISDKVFRVYYDRLVDDNDCSWLVKFMQDVCGTHLKEDFNKLFAHLDFDEDGKVVEDDLRSLLFCDFTDPKNENKNYIEVMDVEKLRKIAEGHLEEFNNLSKKPMNLVLFRYENIIYLVLFICNWNLNCLS